MEFLNNNTNKQLVPDIIQYAVTFLRYNMAKWLSTSLVTIEFWFRLHYAKTFNNTVYQNESLYCTDHRSVDRILVVAVHSSSQVSWRHTSSEAADVIRMSHSTAPWLGWLWRWTRRRSSSWRVSLPKAKDTTTHGCYRGLCPTLDLVSPDDFSK